MKILCLPLVAALLIAGCASTPDPVSTQLPLSSEFRSVATIGGHTADALWWKSFGDAVLDSLVERALENNRDIAIAVQRVKVAQAGMNAQDSRLFPLIGLQASASRNRSGLPDAVKQGQPDTRALRLGLDLSWEIDLAGGVRSARNAAAADARSAQAGVTGTQLMVAGEVARQYFLSRGTAEQLGIVQGLAQAQGDTARLVEGRQRAGQASAFDVDRARAEADSLEAQIPPLRTLIGTTETRLAVLMGANPSIQVDELMKPFVWPAVPTISPGQPSELLQRRPDLLAAEARYAATALRGQEARAQWWPKLFLSALTGSQDLQLNALNLAPVRFSNVALALAAPIFNAGRVEAGIQAESARSVEAMLAWQQAVLTAVREVEDSLLSQAQEQQRADALAKALASRQQSLQHAQRLFRAGQIDLLAQLDVQRSMLSSELAMSASRLQRQLDAVQLFKALGGGFPMRDKSAGAPPAATTIPLFTAERDVQAGFIPPIP